MNKTKDALFVLLRTGDVYRISGAAEAIVRGAVLELVARRATAQPPCLLAVFPIDVVACVCVKKLIKKRRIE